MAKDPSCVIVRGRLAHDPEYRTTGHGTPVTNITILSSGWERDTAGQPVEVTPTSWRCEAWRDLAENIANSLAKGDQVIATAHPRTDKYQRDDGSDAFSIRWVIDDIGPSLQRATARITRQRRGTRPTTPSEPQQPETGLPTAPSDDPWN